MKLCAVCTRVWDDLACKMTSLHSFQFTAKILYRICLILCIIIRLLPLFQDKFCFHWVPSVQWGRGVWSSASHLGIPLPPPPSYGLLKKLEFGARKIDTWACYNRFCEIKVTTSAIYAVDLNIHYKSCAISYAMALIFKSVFAQSNMAGFALKMSEDYSWNCARNYEAQV